MKEHVDCNGTEGALGFTWVDTVCLALPFPFGTLSLSDCKGHSFAVFWVLLLTDGCRIWLSLILVWGLWVFCWCSFDSGTVLYMSTSLFGPLFVFSVFLLFFLLFIVISLLLTFVLTVRAAFGCGGFSWGPSWSGSGGVVVMGSAGPNEAGERGDNPTVEAQANQ